ncbi:ABC transporter ATP-binding protein [Candidatus Beckwithbacteria bacterium]|nr:ABC transporter ATP-binding protein [Candidatus Beckwithbacteria bacterium]
MSSLIRLAHIKKVYGKGAHSYEALRGVSLDIKKGEFVAIMGPSGSGKSTLMNILGTLDTPTSGSYFFNHKKINHYSKKELAQLRNREIGFVFQSFNLLPRLSVAQNIERPMMYGHVPAHERTDRILEVLKLVALEEKYHEPPLNLSGGQQQRIALARALIMRPSLILADEPTGALDSKTAKKIMDELKHINKTQKTTIIIVTHDLMTAQHASRIIKVKDGLIAS